jgi:peptidoglycan/xylan/chitin deacetylase (PgdA/CDA1 family)
MKRRIFIGLGVLVFLGLATFFAIPHVLPWALSVYRPDIQFLAATDEKKLFLTIDDAPSKNTAEILRVLKKHEVTATFFVIANRVKSPAQLDEILAGGHSLGNHLKTTKACSKLSLAEFQADFDACSALVERKGATQLFRPPSDFGTQEQIAYARSKNYRTWMGTVFPLDHWIFEPDRLVRISRWLAVSGGVVILHDGDVRGVTTAEVLDRLLPKLKAAGYGFGRLDQVKSVRP